MTKNEPSHFPTSLVRVLAAVALLAACADQAPRRQAPAAPRPIRLLDELASAEIESPLLGGALERALGGLERLKGKSTWAADLRSPSSYRQFGCHLTDGRLDSASVLACDGESGPFWLRFDIPATAEHSTLLVFEVRAPDPECVELQVQDGFETSRRALPSDGTDWRPVSVLWSGRPEAGQITVFLAKRQVGEPCQLEIRSAKAYTLEHSPDLVLGLLKGQGLAPGADPEIGIGKFGSFLPLADAETVAPPHDDNFSSREALLAPAPTDLCFRLLIPQGGRLLFSYGLSRESRLGDRVDFEILATGETGPERLLWSRQFELTENNWHWHEAAVALEELWGQTTRLVLRTRSPTRQGLALWGSPTIDIPRRNGDPPNVIVIAVDTLRADRLSMYGYPEATSPRLEEFAGDGVLFEHAVSQSNWTVPSFASMFTGQIVARHREITVVGHPESGAATVLPEIFRDQGWRTQAILYKPVLYQRLDRGFEVHFNVPRVHHRADQNLRKALDWLQRAGDQRFFLFLHFNDPHQPFTQPEEFVTPTSAGALRDFGLRLPLKIPQDLGPCGACKSDEGASEPFKTLVHRLYDEEIHYLDGQIGRFLDELRERGLYDDAVIAFVSDHGETLWNHYGFFGHGGVNHHAELTRVPLILKPPAGDRYRRGAVVETRVRAFDLMPTLLALAGIEYPQGDLDASSLLPFMLSTAASTEEDRVAFSHSAAAAALLTDHWKYILPVGRGIGTGYSQLPMRGVEELYDLSRDPGELRDLTDESPQVLESLRAEVFEYLLRTVGGRFLLVRGAAVRPERHLLAACDARCSWDPLLQFGRERIATRPPYTAVFEGAGLGEVSLFARFSGPPPEVKLRVYTAHGEKIEPFALASRVSYEEGVVGRLLRAGEPGAWILEAPERAMAERITDSQMNAQQEKALRALGYLR